jgi:hypothetical protein
MLPGFRFLFTAIVLSMSILIFGLGAAALLRAAHEQFASIPSRRAAPEAMFTQQTGETTGPVLAMLRIDPPPPMQTAPDAWLPAGVTPAETATAPSSAEPERVTAPNSQEAALPDAATPEVAKPDTQAEAPAPGVPSAAPAEAPAETRMAMTEPVPLAAIQAAPPAQAALPPPAAFTQQAALPATDVAPEEATDQISAEAARALSTIATLGGPPVTIETPTRTKLASVKPDAKADNKADTKVDANKTDSKSEDAIRKRQQARRAAKRRRLAAARARLAQQAPRLAADPFAPQPVGAARTP